ncbi:hypothetical protein TRFO_11103 [Tritrichomonas foetus]|uniref:Uncharacterized protein n=1 Tax=Tritrichomonas foetus TaxID=1144522 RepID=A0A1J4J751_9EUKA|nr:hypothetical protein TRFO_11103 [Tritrichomonas foetus]|eukprot:OHS94481.1 hypothetical protein TRFO_11103 [Tritrichomonas foetus]
MENEYKMIKNNISTFNKKKLLAEIADQFDEMMGLRRENYKLFSELNDMCNKVQNSEVSKATKIFRKQLVYIDTLHEKFEKEQNKEYQLKGQIEELNHKSYISLEKEAELDKYKQRFIKARHFRKLREKECETMKKRYQEEIVLLKAMKKSKKKDQFSDKERKKFNNSMKGKVRNVYRARPTNHIKADNIEYQYSYGNKTINNNSTSDPNNSNKKIEESKDENNSKDNIEVLERKTQPKLQIQQKLSPNQKNEKQKLTASSSSVSSFLENFKNSDITPAPSDTKSILMHSNANDLFQSETSYDRKDESMNNKLSNESSIIPENIMINAQEPNIEIKEETNEENKEITGNENPVPIVIIQEEKEEMNEENIFADKVDDLIPQTSKSEEEDNNIEIDSSDIKEEEAIKIIRENEEIQEIKEEQIHSKDKEMDIKELSQESKSQENKKQNNQEEDGGKEDRETDREEEEDSEKEETDREEEEIKELKESRNEYNSSSSSSSKMSHSSSQKHSSSGSPKNLSENDFDDFESSEKAEKKSSNTSPNEKHKEEEEDNVNIEGSSGGTHPLKSVIEDTEEKFHNIDENDELSKQEHINHARNEIKTSSSSNTKIESDDFIP